MVDEDELLLEFVELLAVLHTEQLLELSSIRDIGSLAEQLYQLVRDNPQLDLGDWLLEQDEVTELYLDSDELAARAAPILRRMFHGDPAPQWNAALAAVIHDAPDDLAARQVFGDWLQQAGDPRGDLVAIQLELVRNPSKELERREASFLKKYRSFLLGPLAELNDSRMVYRFGFFDELTIEADRVPAALEHVATWFLRSMIVTGVADLEPIATARLPAALAELLLYAATPNTIAAPLAALTAARPRLHHLELARFDTTIIELATTSADLRVLALGHTKVVVTPGSWAHALPALEKLTIDEVEFDHRDRLAELFAAPPPALRTLAMSDAPMSDAAVVEWLSLLVGSRLLAQLHTLDLSGNHSLAGAVPLLVQHAARFAHLELLDVRKTSLGADAARLKALGPFVRVDPERTASMDDDDEPSNDDLDDEDEDDDDYADYEDDDAPGIDPDTVPEEELEEVDAEADEGEEAPVDKDAPVEERFDEPE